MNSRKGGKKASARPTGGRKSSIRDVCIVSTIGEGDTNARSAARILCPWLRQDFTAVDIWTGVLATHDLNGGLLASLSAPVPGDATVFAGILAIDVLRRPAEIIKRLKAANVNGVINFPSASFIDGDAGNILNSLSLGIDREIDWLTECREAGLRVGGVANSLETAERLLTIGAEFLIVHQGPPVSDEHERSTEALAASIRRTAHAAKILVLNLTQLIRPTIGKGRRGFNPAQN